MLQTPDFNQNPREVVFYYENHVKRCPACLDK